MESTILFSTAAQKGQTKFCHYIGLFSLMASVVSPSYWNRVGEVTGLSQVESNTGKSSFRTLGNW